MEIFSWAALDANLHLVSADGINAIAFDIPSCPFNKIAENRGLYVQAVFLTHCHFDHVGSAEEFCTSGGKIYCSDKEKPLIGTEAELFDLFHLKKQKYTIYDTFTDGETKELYGLKVTALICPGHTTGSTVYLVEDTKTNEKALFTGDTLFHGQIGRTDFPTGNTDELKKSLQRLYFLEGDYPIYCGHEESTTLEEERRNNPYMKDLGSLNKLNS